MLNLQNLKAAKDNLLYYNPLTFGNNADSFRYFLNQIKINDFRHIHNLDLKFNHPVTIISGTNKIGKTSLLLLIACSHENFRKYDSTRPDTVLRNHIWRDVLAFTSYETASRNYSYELFWRVGNQNRQGEGKRTATNPAWTGLGKFSSDLTRINAKIRDKQVRIIDLDRLLPARNFSTSLRRKTFTAPRVRVNTDIEQAFNYIFENPDPIEIYSIGSHINKMAYLLIPTVVQPVIPAPLPPTPGVVPAPPQPPPPPVIVQDTYSSFNAASGEESLLNILVDIFDAPPDSLIMIDELEAGIHPNIQRRLADVIQYVSWHQKKQFIITTHSPTLLSAFPQKSRKFIDKAPNGDFEVVSNISVNAAFSKMDSKGYPLINLYCEDTEAQFIIKSILVEINKTKKHFDRLVNIVMSGPIDQVKNDYLRHKRNFNQLKLKTGFCCVFDGDYQSHASYSIYHENPDEFTFFLYPYVAPEKFLVNAYLNAHPNAPLRSAWTYSDHHALFQEMMNLGLAADENQARMICWQSFENTPEYNKLKNDLTRFLINTVSHFSKLND